MKKIAILILALLYLGTSTGATVYVHYCMGELAYWGFDHDDSAACPGCSMEKGTKDDGSCCKEEQKFIKNSFDQKLTQPSFFFTSLLSTAFAHEPVELTLIQLSSVTESSPVSNAPPQNNKVAVYIFNQSFLI